MEGMQNERETISSLYGKEIKTQQRGGGKGESQYRAHRKRRASSGEKRRGFPLRKGEKKGGKRPRKPRGQKEGGGYLFH